jgi:hypothetical protein
MMKTRFCDEKMQVNLPRELVDAVVEIARRNMVSRSAYCRQAIAEKLERDGSSPFKPKGTEMNYDFKRAEHESLRDLDMTIGCLAATKTMGEAVRLAEARRAPRRVVQTLMKAAQSAATSSTAQSAH